MLEGYRFRSQQDHNRLALAVAWGINFAFADEKQSAGMLEGIGVSTSEVQGHDKTEEQRRAEAQRLYRKIETAQVARRYTLDIKDLA